MYILHSLVTSPPFGLHCVFHFLLTMWYRDCLSVSHPSSFLPLHHVLLIKLRYIASSLLLPYTACTFTPSSLYLLQTQHRYVVLGRPEYPTCRLVYCRSILTRAAHMHNLIITLHNLTRTLSSLRIIFLGIIWWQFSTHSLLSFSSSPSVSLHNPYFISQSSPRKSEVFYSYIYIYIWREVQRWSNAIFTYTQLDIQPLFQIEHRTSYQVLQ